MDGAVRDYNTLPCVPDDNSIFKRVLICVLPQDRHTRARSAAPHAYSQCAHSLRLLST
jgi:hypothetical protein